MIYLLPPSPPAEKASARHGDGTRHSGEGTGEHSIAENKLKLARVRKVRVKPISGSILD